MAVAMEGRVLNLRSILELQPMELSDGCGVKRNKGGLWFGLHNLHAGAISWEEI